MAVDVRSVSRLLFADLKTIDGVEHWDTLVLPDPVEQRDDVQYIVAQGDRVDLISQRFYGDAGLWWVIAWANNLEILPTDLKTGSQIRIPSKNYVQNVLLRNVRLYR